MKSRSLERVFLVLVTVVLGLLFYQLFTVLQKVFAEVPKRLREGTMMNLNDGKPGDRIRTLLEKGYYFQDRQDIELVSNVVAKGLTTNQEVIDNIGELNKDKYSINAEEAALKGGTSYKRRVEVSRSILGFNEDD